MRTIPWLVKYSVDQGEWPSRSYTLLRLQQTQNHRKLPIEGFFVDDLLVFQPTKEKALDLIQTTISRLERYDFYQCMVQSNSKLVRTAFLPKEHLPEILNLNETNETNPLDEATSIRLQWHISQDTFSIKAWCKDGSLTKLGLLHLTMSVYDPRGIAVPARLSSKFSSERWLLERRKIHASLTP